MKRTRAMKLAGILFASVLMVCPGSCLTHAAEDTDLQVQNETLESENTRLKEENEALESENAELKENKEALESENAELKEQITAQGETGESETETLSTEVVGVEYTDKSVVKIVQEALNKEGFDCGTPDGVAGSKTVEAILAYQKEKGINANGVITDELLTALEVADKVDEAVKAEAQKAEYSADYSYEQLARNPDTYIGDKVKFSGKVLQAQTGDVNYIRLAIDSNYDTILFVTYDSDIIDYRLLEDDYITIYGTSFSTYSYEAVSGATITLPWIVADMIEMN